MKISSIKSMITNYKVAKENRFLDKYCRVDLNLPADAYNQLMRARKGTSGLAAYAKSKGVTIEISDAEQKMSKTFFESVIDEMHMKRAAEGQLNITVTQEKPSKGKYPVINSLTSFVSKDTKKIKTHSEPDYIVIDYPEDGIQQTRLTSHQFEDNFLRTVYRQIEKMANALTGNK